MILTCPSCSALFSLDNSLLGNAGSKVKCGSCGEIWFQEPESESDLEESVVSDLNDITEEILEKEIESEENLEDSPPELDTDSPPNDIDDKPTIAKQNTTNKSSIKNMSSKKDTIISISIAASIFIIIFTYLLLNSTSLTTKHPSMYAFYSLFGVSPDIPGQGLVFDQVKAQHNGKKLIISGNVVNIESEENKVPMVEASLIDGSDNIVSKWYIELPKDMMAADSSMAFNSAFDIEVPSNAQLKTNLRFVLFINEDSRSKTDEVIDGNNPNQHQGDSDHQNAHEESSKSHQPSSSESHQEPSRHHGH